MNASTRNWGVMWLLGAGLCFASVNISIKIGGEWATGWQMGFGRFLFGLLTAPLMARLMGQSIMGRSKGLLVLRGLTGAATFMGLIAAIHSVELSTVMVLFYLYPAIAAVVSPLILKEATDRRDWPFIIGAILGSALILYGGGSGFELKWGHAFALLAALACGTQLSVVRLASRNNSVTTIYFYFCLVGAAVCFGPLVTDSAGLVPPSQGLIWVGTAAVMAMIAQLMFNKGLTMVQAAKAGPIIMIEAPATVLFGVLALSEPITLKFVIGGLMVLGCGLYINLRPALEARRLKRPAA